MGAAAAAMVGLNVLQGTANASMQKAQAKYQASQMNQNAKLANMQAEDSLRRGEEQAYQIRKQSKSLIGSQRASYAAQGIDVSSGSALDVQGDTAALAELDALTIKNNAFKEAMGYKIQASQLKSNAKAVKSFGQMQSNLSLLGGGIGAVGSYYQYKQ